MQNVTIPVLPQQPLFVTCHSINQPGASLSGIVDHDLLCISTPSLLQGFYPLFYTQLLHQFVQHQILFRWFPVLHSLPFIAGVKRYLSYSLLIACTRKVDCHLSLYSIWYECFSFVIRRPKTKMYYHYQIIDIPDGTLIIISAETAQSNFILLMRCFHFEHFCSRAHMIE